MQKVILFYNGLEVLTRQILDLKGVIPSKTAADGKAQLNNLGKEIKKVNEKVYAGQVGCEQCKEPHYTKDCPLNEKGLYQRNNANPSYQERRQSMKLTLSKFKVESAKRHEENSNMIKEIRASTDAAIRKRASIKTLEIQIGQMSKEKDLGSFTLPCCINNVCFDNALADLGANECKVIEEVKARNDARMVSNFFGYPSDYDQIEKILIDCAHNLKFSCMIGMDELGNWANVLIFIGNFYVLTSFVVVEDMDPYIDEGMREVVVGKPFCKVSCVETKRFNGIINIHKEDESGQPVVGSKKNPRILFSLRKILFPNSLMDSFLPQERQFSEMKFPTFNNGLMNRFMRHEIDTKISFVQWQSVGKAYSRCVDDYRKQIQAELTHAVNQQTSAVTTAMTAILKQFQETPTPASVKAIEEICVTGGGAHPYYQCLTADGNTFLEFQDNIQGYVLATAVNYNQGNSGYRPLGVANQIRPPGFAQPNVQNNQNRPLPSNTVAKPKGKFKAITTRSGLVLDEPSIPMPPPVINLEEDEHVEETLMDPKLREFTITVPPPLVQKAKPPSQRNYMVHQRDPLHPNIPYPSRMHKQKQQDKDEIQIHKFWKMFKQLHINITLADALKKVVLPELISTCITLELANQAICTPAGIARDVFVLVGKFTFPSDFVIIDYKSDPRVPLILGRPFLWTAHALIDVHGDEMILRDGDERLTLNMRHKTLSYSNQLQKESINMINIYDHSYEDYLEDLFATNDLSGNPTFSSHSDLTSPKISPPNNINTLSGSTTSSSSSIDHLLEEFADELALITFPFGNDDLSFDIKTDLRKIEYLLNDDPTKEMDSILEDLIDESNLADPNDNLVDTIPEMFTDEHALDYSSPPLYDDFDDDLDELEFDNDDAYNDPFDSKEDKIKDSKLLIDELDLPRSSDFLPSPEISWILETRDRGFVLRSLDLHIFIFILRIQYPNLID
nr:hypothetical protein [Tanacetum cinerariifolium]